MSTSIGIPVITPEPSAPSEFKFAQSYACVSELLADMEAPGGDEARLLAAIREASAYLQKEIGWFIPVKQTLSLRGSGKASLRVTPFLSLTGDIVNGDDTLTSADVVLLPDGRFWAGGPYVEIQILSDAGQVWCEDDPNSVQASVWSGLYQEIRPMAVTLGSTQSVAAETLTVSDGSKVSPGMVLSIGDEQELVTGTGAATDNVTTLSAAAALGDEYLTLTSATNVKVGEIIRVDFEQMRVRDIRSGKAAVMRGWNGTPKAAHLINAEVDVYRTFSVERAVNGTSAAEHLASVSIGRYVPPEDILFLARQIATLMINKAKGGYAGKTGNVETGQVFYNDAFPRYEIERIKKLYYIPRMR